MAARALSLASQTRLRCRQKRCMSVVTRAEQRNSSSSSKREREPRTDCHQPPGDFYVDSTCIDCDTCRWMAPATFARVGNSSAVVQQPATAEERQKALEALLSCPTHSIHARQRQPGELAAARDSFPLPIPGCGQVYHCGYHSEDSFGATSYFIRRPLPTSGPGSSTEPYAAPSPAHGNIMVDAPRWQPQLAARLRALGGVSWIVLSHSDDVAAHAEWAAAFPGCRRVIHRKEANRRQGTDKAEVLLEGEGPWALDGTPLVEPESSGGGGGGQADARIIFTPGHTAGCISLYFPPDRALFTGDHLAFSARLQRLTIFRAYNWYNVDLQLESVARLLLDPACPFLHLLPGHGRRTSFASDQERVQAVLQLLREERHRGYEQVAQAVGAAAAATK